MKKIFFLFILIFNSNAYGWLIVNASGRTQLVAGVINEFGGFSILQIKDSTVELFQDEKIEFEGKEFKQAHIYDILRFGSLVSEKTNRIEPDVLRYDKSIDDKLKKLDLEKNDSIRKLEEECDAQKKKVYTKYAIERGLGITIE